jgi:hypothetical protein
MEAKTTLDKLADANAARFTVGFARKRPIPGGGNCFGSGVLVRYGNVAGILTCAHVVDAVLTEESIGIICNGPRDNQKQAVTVDRDSIRSLVLKGPGPEDEGPDLGFVALPAITMSALEALGSTLNLTRQKERYQEPLRSYEYMELFSGVPGEWMDEPEDKGTHIELGMTTMLISGQLKRFTKN